MPASFSSSSTVICTFVDIVCCVAARAVDLISPGWVPDWVRVCCQSGTESPLSRCGKNGELLWGIMD